MSVIDACITTYKVWHQIQIHIQKSSRYTLGEKIDRLFIETLELFFIAQYLPQLQKLPTLQRANAVFDKLKFFVTILWEMGELGTKQYAHFAQHLNKVGAELHAWLEYIAGIKN